MMFPIWKNEYQYAASLLKDAKSIEAVDFMKPSDWFLDSMSDYVDAQKENKHAGSKERVHIYSETELNKAKQKCHKTGASSTNLVENYKQYIDLQRRMGFTTYFHSNAKLGFKEGFLIIDKKIVLCEKYGKKVRYEMISAKDDCIHVAHFNQSDIVRYRNLFEKN